MSVVASSLEDDMREQFEVYRQSIAKQVGQYQELFDKFASDEKYASKSAEGSTNTTVIPDIRIVNIVISARLTHVDIDRVKADMNTEYYPKKFPGSVFRMRNPRCALLIFKTGKVILTGIRNVEDAYTALDIFCKRFNTEYNDFKVQNLVLSVDFKHYIDLEETVNSIPRSIYEPAQFPGIIYRNVDPKAVFLVFSKGKCICVGTNNIEQAFAAVFYLRKILIDGNLLIPRE